MAADLSQLTHPVPRLLCHHPVVDWSALDLLATCAYERLYEDNLEQVFSMLLPVYFSHAIEDYPPFNCATYQTKGPFYISITDTPPATKPHALPRHRKLLYAAGLVSKILGSSWHWSHKGYNDRCKVSSMRGWSRKAGTLHLGIIVAVQCDEPDMVLVCPRWKEVK